MPENFNPDITAFRFYGLWSKNVFSSVFDPNFFYVNVLHKSVYSKKTFISFRRKVTENSYDRFEKLSQEFSPE